MQKLTLAAPRDRKEVGFSLIELLVVVVIMGILASMAVKQFSGQDDKARQTTAQYSIEVIGTSMDLYRLDVGYYPSSDEGIEALLEDPGNDRWQGPYMKKFPMDPWGRAFVYRSPGEESGHEYEILSLGKDGEVGGEDFDMDILSWDP